MKTFELIIPNDVAGKTLRFESIEDLHSWANQEQQAYEWLSKINLSFSRHLLNHVTTQFQHIHHQIRAINQSISRSQPFEGHIDAIGEWFSSTYTTKKLYLSTSSEFKAVLDLKKTNLIKAGVFLGHLIEIANLYQGGIESIQMLEASNEYFKYINGMSSKDLSAQRQALEELKNDWDNHLVTYQNQEDKLKTDFEITKTNFDKYFKETQTNIAEHLSKHTKDLEELKTTYDQHMSLKAPVEYWKNKRQKHKDSSALFKWWSIAIGIIGAIFFSFFLSHFFSDNGLSYWKAAVFIFLGTLFFWTLRVLVKLMLSHIHLEGDAHEREVMCQTYLALLRNNSGLEENDKKLILTTLFRPSSSGIMGEDGIPPGFYDVLTKIASR